MHSSYVLTDPKGTTILEVGNAFVKKGYRIKIFNCINFKKSMHYNPFAYIHSEKDILKLVTTLMTNTRGEGKGGDPFWDKAEKLLLTALIAYIHYEAPAEEHNFATLLEFLNVMEVREDDEAFQNPVDQMFEKLGEQQPNHFAVRQYRLYKLAAGKTAKSILISCGARLAPFDIAELREITAYDELELDTLGGSENTTLKELAAALGKETIDLYNTSDTRGNSPSYGTSYQKTGHELMSRDELAVMDGGKCILQLRGVRPFLSDKYDLTQHPNYKLTGDYDKKNIFDIEKYLDRHLKLKPSDTYDVMDADTLSPMNP